MLDYIKRFFVKNTPEAALMAALLASGSGYYTGALSPHEAVMAVIGALIAYGFAEANKDGRENQAVTSPADNPVPPTP